MNSRNNYFLRRRKLQLISLLLILLLTGVSHSVSPLDGSVPRWLNEPPSELLYLRTTGGSTSCRAVGAHPLRVTWVDRDGNNVPPVGRVRQLLNGTLLLLPDAPPTGGSLTSLTTVPGSPFHCRASNPYGIIISRAVHATPVASEPWDVQVYDVHVERRNAAVLTCTVVPASLAPHISVTSWTRGHISYYPGQNNGGRVEMVVSGELVVSDVSDERDAGVAIRCRAVHSLTGVTKESIRPANIHITEAMMPVQPRISVTQSRVRVRAGSPTTLLCPAHGYPPPLIRWFKRSMDGRDLPITDSVYHSDSPVSVRREILAVPAAAESHTGLYSCIANNTAGTASMQVQLQVISTLLAQVRPPTLQVDAGGRASFTCDVKGSPIEGITWLHDGVPVTSRGRRLDTSGRSLVLDNVRASDSGVYQCSVEGGVGRSAVASATLSLGDTPPVLQYRFIEQTLQPGPSVSLKCIASGSPTPSVTWTLDSYPLPHTDRLVRGQYVGREGEVISHVNISRVMVEDGGLYGCRASNTAASVTHTARLNVYGRPVVRHMGEVTGVAGEQLILTCPVGGYPIHTITWDKDGSELPLSHRQVVHSNGSLVVHNVQSNSDAGVYSCTASDREGHSSSQSVSVRVLVPPRLLPIHPTHYLREGSRLTLTCVVSEGDMPISFIWTRDGSAKLEPDVEVNTLGDFNSYLRIPNLQPQHSGNYSCRAENAASHSELTTSVFVNVPPSWEIEPQDVTVITGHDLTLTCAATGFPLPTVTWRREIGSEPGGRFTTLMTQQHRSGVSPRQHNGTLELRAVTKDTQGRYLCEATNGIGAGLNKLINVWVNAPPSIPSTLPTEVRKGTGSEVTLKCPVEGDRPIKVTWYKGGQPLSADRPYRYKMTEGRDTERQHQATHYRAHPTLPYGPGAVGGSSFQYFMMDAPVEGSRSRNSVPNHSPEGESDWWGLTIKDLSRTDEGEYTCTASNDHGHDSHTFTLLVLMPPSLPRSLHVSEKGSRSVVLSWSPPEDGNSPITQYSLRYTLTPDTHDSDPTASNPTVITSGSVDHQSRHVALEKIISGSETTVSVGPLMPASTYIFTLFAHNALGASRPSEPLQVTTDGEVPGAAPTAVIAKALSASTVSLTWQPPAPELRHGEIVAYYVLYKQSSDSSHYQQLSVDPLSASSPTCCHYSLRSLTPYTTYSIMLQAVNQQGAGPKSDPVEVLTLEDVPTVSPGNLRCSALSSSSVAVSWDSLSTIQARGEVQGYRLNYAVLDSGATPEGINSPAPHLTLDSLHPYTNYSVTVAAYTRVGTGVSSEPTLCTTMEDVPGAPANIKAVWEGRDSVIVSWQPPASPNGQLLSYSLTTATQTLYPKKHEVKDGVTQYRLTLPDGESPLRRMRVRVAAVNRVGEGPPTDPVIVSIPKEGITGRGVPAGILSWGSEVSVHWREDASLRCEVRGVPSPVLNWTKEGREMPQSDGRINWYTDGTLVLRDAQPADSGNYTCSVANPHGKDAITYVLSVQVPPSPPSVTVTAKDTSSLLVTWSTSDQSKPEDGAGAGAPILGVTVSYKRDYGEWREVTVTTNTLQHLLTNLDCGVKYQIFLTAHNKVGSSRPSEMVTASTEGGPPTFQGGSSASAVMANSTRATVSVSGWSDNGCAISHFTVAYRKRQNSNGWIMATDHATVGSYVDLTGLWPSTRYVARVTAHSVAGNTAHDYTFTTAHIPGGMVGEPRHIVEGASVPLSRYVTDVRVLLPLLASSLVLVAVIVSVAVIFRKKWWWRGSSPHIPSAVPHPSSPVKQLEHQDGEAEVLYGTVRKMSSPQLFSSHATDSAPEYPEDIYPYATFQMNTLHNQRMQQQQQQQQQQQPPYVIPQNNRSKKHHLPQQHHQQVMQQARQHKNNQQQSQDSTASIYQPYIYTADVQQSRRPQCDQDLLPVQAPIPSQHNKRCGSDAPNSLRPLEGRPRHPTPRPPVSESEEYDDSYDDSETDPTSRTESSARDPRSYLPGERLQRL